LHLFYRFIDFSIDFSDLFNIFVDTFNPKEFSGNQYIHNPLSHIWIRINFT